MKPSTPYQREKANALSALRNYSQIIKGLHSKTDRAGVRMQINDMAHSIADELPRSLTAEQRERITLALHSLACKLHPKK